MTHEAPKLLPCPFCGSEARVFGSDMVGCVDQTNCGANVDWGHYTTGSGPIDVWNTRADLAAAQEAAAYERAADTAKEIADLIYVGYMSRIEKAIRALATPDQTDALEAAKREARNEALREAAALVGVKVGHGGEAGNCQCGKCVGRRDDHAEILALIEKGPEK